MVYMFSCSFVIRVVAVSFQHGVGEPNRIKVTSMIRFARILKQSEK